MRELDTENKSVIENDLLQDLKKFSVGELDIFELEEKLIFYEHKLGKERVLEIRSGNQNDKQLGQDIMAITTGVLLLALKADEKWKNISAELDFRNEDFIGKFLLARLKLEHIVNLLLVENLKEVDESMKKQIEIMNFNQRLRLLPKSDKSYSKYLPLLYEINSIRNELVHNPKFDIDGFEFKKVKNIEHLADINKIKGKERLTLILELITLISCYLLYETVELRSIKDPLKEKFPDIDL